MKNFWIAFLFTTLLILSTFTAVGCGIAAIDAHAQTTAVPGFTPSSRVVAKSNGLFDVGAEALIADTHTAGLGSFNLPFTLPSNQTVVRFQGSFSWADDCQGDVLFALVIDGVRYDAIILKSKGVDSNVWFDYTMPIPTGSGSAQLHIEGNPACLGDYDGMSSAEIQAMIQVQ